MKRLLSRLWGWLKALSIRAKVLIAVMLAALVGFLIWAVFFWFAFQTYFIDDTVDEAGPVFDSGVVAAGTMPGDEVSEELQAEMDEVMEEEGMPAEVDVEEAMPDMPEQPQIRVEASGPFINRSHPTRGNAIVLGDGTGQRFLRFEDFRTDNGPDLNVYLTTAPQDAPAGQFDDDFIDLGDLKGNVGSQNYEISRDVDLSRYSTVVVWCVRFSVAFGAATLAPA